MRSVEYQSGLFNQNAIFGSTKCIEKLDALGIQCMFSLQLHNFCLHEDETKDQAGTKI